MSIYDKFKPVAKKLIGTFKNPNTITHQRYSNSSDGMGGFTQTWATIASGIEGAVLRMSGDEKLDAQRLNYEATHNIFVTFDDGSDIRPEDRLIFAGRTFAVVDPRNIAEGGAAMKIRVKEGVGN